jgi:hypothetical protein
MLASSKPGRETHALYGVQDCAGRRERDRPRYKRQWHRSENQSSESTGFSKKVFLASFHRLADSRWFSPQLIVRGLDEVKARKHFTAAQQLMSRLHELIGELRREFPEL